MTRFPAPIEARCARGVASRLGLAALLLMTGGCVGLFEPSTPQAPASGSVNISVDYRDVNATLATMAAGIAAKGLGNGKAAYIGAFADSTVDGVPFYATFDPEVASRYPTVPTWNRQLEEDFYPRFVALRSEAYLLRWSEANAPGDEIDVVSGDAELYRKYEVFTLTPEGETLDRIAIGVAHLFYKRIGTTRWLITRWEDLVDPAIGPSPSDESDLSMSARRLEN